MEIAEVEPIRESDANSFRQSGYSPSQQRTARAKRKRRNKSSPNSTKKTEEWIRNPSCPQFWSDEASSRLVAAALSRKIEDLDCRLYALSAASNSLYFNLSILNEEENIGYREAYLCSAMQQVEKKLNAVKARVGEMPPVKWYHLTNYTDLGSGLRFVCTSENFLPPV